MTYTKVNDTQYYLRETWIASGWPEGFKPWIGNLEVEARHSRDLISFSRPLSPLFVLLLSFQGRIKI